MAYKKKIIHIKYRVAAKLPPHVSSAVWY